MIKLGNMFLIIQYKTRKNLKKKKWDMKYPVDQICDEYPPFHPLYFIDKNTAWQQLEEWGIEKNLAEAQNIEVVGLH
tara:strand:- start:6238 stop:6468 length:231 start_codon:yes stop_codon:yes gene_type:complete